MTDLSRIAVLILVLLSGCTGQPQTEADRTYTEFVSENRRSGIDRYYDKEYGVVCYRYHGISCVKVNQ